MISGILLWSQRRKARTLFFNGNGAKYKSKLSDKEFQDLCIVRRECQWVQNLNRKKGNSGGLRLSYATLGAFIKYPKPAFSPTYTPCCTQKIWFFSGTKSFFDILSKELGLADSIQIRHPLAYLVEAADDICYTIIDFEDGIHLGWIDEEYALEYLINLVKEDMDTLKYSKLKHRTQRLGLRALAINSLIKDAVRVFTENETDILNGSFGSALLEKANIKRKLRILLI